MNTINVPIVNYKMDKVKFIIILAIVAIVLIIVINPKGVFTNLITGVGNFLKGAGEGIVTGLGQVTGLGTDYTQSDALSARIDKFWTGNTWVNWVTPDLYNSDPSQITISQQDAVNLYNNIKSGEGTQVMGILFSHGDMSGIQSDFSSVVGNKFDISYVSFIAQQQEGNDLGKILQNPTNFYNDSVGSSGESNLQMLAEFLEWANGLPQY